jgi:hypothetical protein
MTDQLLNHSGYFDMENNQLIITALPEGVALKILITLNAINLQQLE